MNHSYVILTIIKENLNNLLFSVASKPTTLFLFFNIEIGNTPDNAVELSKNAGPHRLFK